MQDGNSEYQWLKLDKYFFNLKKDIYICLLYLVPQSSPYLSKMGINVLETIEKDIVEKYNNKGDIILMGDFNARTGNEDDFISNDAAAHIPVSNDFYPIDTAVGKRSSHDTIVDTRGKELLDICISNQLRITNGRIFGDSYGAYTCYKAVGCSVIDYVIVSQDLLSQLLYMSVSDFFTDMSDCHSRISFKLLASFEREPCTKKLKNFPERYRWDDLSCDNFQRGFSNPIIQNKIKKFLENEIELTSNHINNATSEFHSIFQ